MPFFAILELFLLLFIPCIQKSRKLFDCNEHILCAQYHGEELFPASFRKPIWGREKENPTEATGREGQKKKDSFTERKSTFSFLTDVFGMEPFPVTNLLIFWCNWALCAAVKSCVKAFFFFPAGFDGSSLTCFTPVILTFCTQLCHRFENPLWPAFLPWRHPSARGRFTPLSFCSRKLQGYQAVASLFKY